MKITRSLRKNRAFRQVYAEGGAVANRLLVLYAQPNLSPGNRLGISVSRKVGKAVTRNRVKRLVKESYRLAEGQIAAGYDLVVVARAAAGALEKKEAFTQIQQALTRLLEKRRLLSA